MKKFELLNKEELENFNGGVALGPLIWFKLLPQPKYNGNTPKGLVIL